MLAAFCTAKDDSASCATLLGLTSKNQNSNMHFISFSNNGSSFISSSNSDGMDSCSFYSGPSDETIMAFGESCGSIAYSGGGESCGSIAYSGGGESCGSIASSSGGGCSYSC